MKIQRVLKEREPEKMVVVLSSVTVRNKEFEQFDITDLEPKVDVLSSWTVDLDDEFDPFFENEIPEPEPPQALPAELQGMEVDLEEKGWFKDGRGYSGTFNLGNAKYNGYLAKRNGDEWEAWIYDPPMKLLVGDHRMCFYPVRDGWYSVHIAHGDLTVPWSLIMAIQDAFDDSGFRRRLLGF